MSLGNFAFQQKDYPGAISAFEQALKVRPGDGNLNLKMGLAFFNQETYDQSIQHLIKVLEIDPTQVNVYYYLGLSYDYNKQEDEAIKALETYVEKETSGFNRQMLFKGKTLLEDLKLRKYKRLLGSDI